MNGTHNSGKTVVTGGSTVQVSTNGSYQGQGVRNGDGSVTVNGQTHKPNG